MSGAPTVLRAATNPLFRRLLASFAVSATGDWLYVIALTVWVFEQTHSPAWVAGTSIVRLLPFVLLGSAGGAAVDRFGARRVLMLADIGRAALMLALVAVLAGGGSVAVGLALAATTTALSTVGRPGAAALTPRLVGEDDLAAANAAAEAIQNIALMLGPAIGGVLLARTSATVAVSVTGLAFVASAALVSRVRVPDAGPVRDARTPAEVDAPTRVGHVLRSPMLVALLAVTFMIGCQWGNENVLYVLFADRVGTGPNGLGYFLGAIGLGGLLAAVLPHGVMDSRRPGRVVVLACLAVGLPMVGASWIRSPWPVYALLLVDGVGCIVCQVVTATLMQRITPAGLLGRVFGVHLAVLYGGTLLGSTVAAGVVGRLGVVTSMRITGLLVPVTGLLVSPLLAAAGEAAQRRRDAVSGRVALLERLRIFEGAAPGVVEEIAGGMAAEQVPAGQVLIREGDPADDFFVAVDGSYTVSSGGTSLPTMGPGDYFGEIGLLQRRPRTATVRAATDGEVFRIRGDDFVRAISHGPSMSASLRRGMDVRLGRTHAPA